MTVLTYNVSQDEKRWVGRGVELLRSSMEPYPKNGLPETIDIGWLRANPNMLPLLRRVAKYALLKQDKPDITSNEIAGGIMETLHKSPIKKVGYVDTERTDGDRTTNYVIPLETDEGAIEIVVNGAWGVSWRLCKDHKLVQQYPSLAMCQPEDTSQKPGERAMGEKQVARTHYLLPDVLESITQEQINPRLLAGRIQIYLQKLLLDSEIKYKKSNSDTKNIPMKEDGVQDLSLETDVKSIDTTPHFGISLELGNSEGIKSIRFFGYPGKTMDIVSPLMQEAQELGKLTESFYSPIFHRGKGQK